MITPPTSRFCAALFIAAVALFSSPPASAQTPSANPSDNADVTVERIRPEDLPGEEESSFPSVLRQTDALPRPASLSELRRGGERVAASVYEVVTVQIPKPPIRATPLLTTGHAVWISAEEGGVRPILVTPHSWLEGADSIWVRPAPSSGKDLPSVKRRSIADMSDTRRAERFVKSAAREGWTRVRAGTVDKHRNLATLIAGKDNKLEAPTTGLKLFDTTSKPTSRVYGFSPSIGSALVETQYVEPSGDLALSYYLEVTFGAVLGAPLVTDEAEIVGLTVFRHPEEPARTLVIPPIALAKFVTRAQGITDDAGPLHEKLDDDS